MGKGSLLGGGEINVHRYHKFLLDGLSAYFLTIMCKLVSFLSEKHCTRYEPVITTLPAPSFIVLNTVLSWFAQSTQDWTASLRTLCTADGPNCAGKCDILRGLS